MNSTYEHIERLRADRHLESSGYRSLLSGLGGELTDQLCRAAREVADERFGRTVYVRGLVEIGNHCRNGCYYCGLRAPNRSIERYRLSAEQIVECCARGCDLGLRTFVLQGGDDPVQDDDWVVELVERLRSRFGDSVAITLSIGERSRESYARYRLAGVDRYLLRHETANADHYGLLHPRSMSIERRKECLSFLKALGYQTGTGFMVGSPFQTIDNLIEDVEFVERFAPQMIGIGPFVAASNTPFSDFQNGSVELTLRLIAIFRLMFPDALIPATTALATLSPNGRIMGLEAGANVIMPNLSPQDVRRFYSIYDNKASWGNESSEGLQLSVNELASAGYQVDWGRGDYRTK